MAMSLWGRSKGKKAIKRMEEVRAQEEREWKEKEKELKRMEEERARREKAEEMAREISEREAEQAKTESDRRVGVLLSNIDHERTTYNLDMDVMGLVDRLEAHPAGKKLQNVVISGKPPKDRAQNLSRLRTFQPKNDKAVMSLEEIPAIRLTDRCFLLSLKDAFSPKEFRDLKPYVLVSDIFIHYIPMDTFLSVSHPVVFNICDFRRIENEIVRGFSLTHTIGENILFTLDYCISKEDLDKICLSVSSSLDSFRPGTQWAAAKVLVSAIHMDFPIKSNLQSTQGVMHMSDSDLQDYITDPRFSDGVITPQAMKLLKDAYKRGEIEDTTKHTDDKMEVNVARTQAMAGEGSQDVGDIKAVLREAYLKKERERSNVKTEGNPSGILKHKSEASSSKQKHQPQVQDTDPELEPGHSISNQSSVADESFHLTARGEEHPTPMRAVNWANH
jgi:hypothetical protein